MIVMVTKLEWRFTPDIDKPNEFFANSLLITDGFPPSVIKKCGELVAQQIIDTLEQENHK
jgi:hypothetical protein